MGTGQPDLLVKELSLRGVLDATTGLLVVQPNAIDVTVVVRNAGDGRSDAKPLLLQLGRTDALLLTVPALGPAEEYARTVRINAPAATFLAGTDSTNITASLVTIDRDDSNNDRTSAPFHLALPAIRITGTLDSAMVRGGAAVPGTVRVENVSRHASFGVSTVTYCVHVPERTCSDDPASIAFDRTVIPALAPGQVIVLNKPLIIPPNTVDQNRVITYAVTTCISSGASEQPAVAHNVVCAGARDVMSVPDYETCDPVALTPGVATAATTGCSVPCEIAVFSVNVLPGNSYFVETDAGREEITLRWRTRFREDPTDASGAAGFQPVTAGTVYLVTAPKYCGINPAERRIVLRVTTNSN